MNRIELFIFDMDGVIFEKKNFWFDLHKKHKNHHEALQFYKSNKNKGYSYPDIFRMMTQQFWLGVKNNFYLELIAKRRYSKDIQRVFQYLKDNKIKTAIISSGPFGLAKRAQVDLAIDHIYANNLEFEGDFFTGNCELMVNNDNKMIAVKDLIDKLSLNKKKIAFMGDSSADSLIAKEINVSFSYNSISWKLKNSCKYNLQKNDLLNVIELLEIENGLQPND